MKKDKTVTYYPIFDDSDELTSHYYRACWYLPNMNNRLKNVYLFADSEVQLMDCPQYMTNKTNTVDHIIVDYNTDEYEKYLEEANVILIWRESETEEEKWKKSGKKVVHVETNNEESIEYGKYCSLLWSCIKTNEEKQALIENSRNRFLEISDRIKSKNYTTSCVFGTGPSIDEALSFDFSDCFCVVCNSIVQNRELLDHIKPWFITAGDVVSHLGVSKYAEVFRKDLINYLCQSDTYMITTAPYGYILIEQCPEIADKIILVEQGLKKMNMDLCKDFLLPTKDSTLNIHMLPLANTFGKTIYFLGCDGKNPNGNNEDFWAHSRKVQYHDLVITGHQCHPTFDVRRQKVTYTRYNDSVLTSLEEGEAVGKKYFTLFPSFTEGLRDRCCPKYKNAPKNSKGQIIVAKLGSNAPFNDDETNRVRTKKKLRIAIMATMPKDMYSGGRYHAWIMAEALSYIGHDVYFILNNYPIFYDDFSNYKNHKNINVIKTQDKHFNIRLPKVKKFDFVIVAPNQDRDRTFYDECRMFAIRKKAKLVLINYESRNWFESFIKNDRDNNFWWHWRGLTKAGCLVLSSANESMKWAKKFYIDNPRKTRFDVWNPAINSVEADRIDVEKEKRIVMFIRLTDAHKGGSDILKIACEELKGYTFVFLVGSKKIDPDFLDRLKEIEDRYGIRSEIKLQLNDYEKYVEIKRAQYLIFPSYFEGYGYPPIEAQYCDTQCLAYDLPVLRETCGNRVIYCEYGNVQDIKNKLLQSIDNKGYSVNYKEEIFDRGNFVKRAEDIDRLLQKYRKDNYNNKIYRTLLWIRKYLFSSLEEESLC